MIAFIRGTVASYGDGWVIIDHDGMGWKVSYAHCDQLSLNESVQVFTYMHITENDVSLYGFESREEQDLFLRLLSVKGLGPKTAMNMLGARGAGAIINAVETGDVSALKKMPGIGAKTASQIVLDLKGKLIAVPQSSSANAKKTYPQEIEDALNGLRNLGYKPSELSGVGEYLSTQPGLTAEKYLKLGLQYMMKQKMGG